MSLLGLHFCRFSGYTFVASRATLAIVAYLATFTLLARPHSCCFPGYTWWCLLGYISGAPGYTLCHTLVAQ